LPDTMPGVSLVRAIRSIATAGGSAFELDVAHDAQGYRLTQDAERRRVTLEISRSEHDTFEPFAPESPPGERRLRVVVIDPAHGGSDAGVVSGAAIEKDLTLALARRLDEELGRQGIRTVLTRTDDRDVPAETRAEIANRVG